MGISVISSANLNAGGNAATGLQPATDGGSDFSALLGLQLANPQLLDLQSQVAASPLTAKSDKGEDGAATEDPASLLAAAGLLPNLLANAGHSAIPVPRQGNGDALAGTIGKAADLTGRAAASEEQAGGDRLFDLGPGKSGTAEEGGKLLLNAAATAKPDSTTPGDTANIAADTQPGANAASNFAATLAAHTGADRAAQNESIPAAQQIGVPLHDGRWAQDLGDKVVWLAKNDQQTAQININPPQLGPMHITLNLSGDQVSALFVSPHAEVRQAIEDAMPQLRDMLAGAGINLGQSNVGAQLPQQNSGTPQQFSDSPRFSGDNAILHGDSGRGTTALPQPTRSGRGMVDLFA